MEFGLLKDIVLLLGLALFTLLLFRQFKIPSIIGFLVTGIIAGPHALGLVNNIHEVEQMAEIGVVLLLFTIGIEFSLKDRTSRKVVQKVLQKVRLAIGRGLDEKGRSLNL